MTLPLTKMRQPRYVVGGKVRNILVALSHKFSSSHYSAHPHVRLQYFHPPPKNWRKAWERPLQLRMLGSDHVGCSIRGMFLGFTGLGALAISILPPSPNSKCKRFVSHTMQQVSVWPLLGDGDADVSIDHYNPVYDDANDGSDDTVAKEKGLGLSVANDAPGDSAGTPKSEANQRSRGINGPLTGFSLSQLGTRIGVTSIYKGKILRPYRC